MKIYDSHIHMGEWNYEYYQTISPTIKNIDKVLMDSGIDGALILPSDKLDNEGCLEELKSAKLDYWYFAWIDPKRKEMISWLKNNVHRIDGIKCHAGQNKIRGNISNPLYRPILDIAKESNLPMLVHSGRWQEMSSYKDIFKMAQEYPSVKFICAHLGGDFEGLKIEAPKVLKGMGLSNVWFDISATREYWTIKMAGDTIGYDRLLFASDYPVMHPKMSIESVENLNIMPKDKEKMYYKNFIEIVGSKV